MGQLHISWPRPQMEMICHLHALADLPPRNEPQYPLDRRLCGSQRRSGRCVEDKGRALPGIEPVARRCTD
jgi:hypothetical protein